MVENGGSKEIGISKIMTEVGYSPNTVKTPQKLTESKGWNELCETYLPDDELVKIHKFGLYAYKRDHSQTGPDEDVPDFGNIHKFLETAYRIKGKLSSDVNIHGDKVLVIPSELIAKYDIASNPETSSQ